MQAGQALNPKDQEGLMSPLWVQEDGQPWRKHESHHSCRKCCARAKPSGRCGTEAGGADTVEGTQECACAVGASPGSAKAPAQRAVGVWEVGHRKMGAGESPQHGRGMLGDRAVWGTWKRPSDPPGID